MAEDSSVPANGNLRTTVELGPVATKLLGILIKTNGGTVAGTINQVVTTALYENRDTILEMEKLLENED